MEIFNDGFADLDYKKHIKWVNRKDVDFAYFEMSVKGGKLPENFEVFIKVRVSTHKVALDERIRDVAVAGWRIAVQKMLRMDAGEIVCLRLQRDGFACNMGTAIDTKLVLTTQDRVSQAFKWIEDDFDEDAIKALKAKLDAIK